MIGITACSEPDERLPWPTAQEEIEMPVETLGLWKSPCVPYEENSRYFELKMNPLGEFVATERIHQGSGCKGLADDIRIRKGHITAVEAVGEKSWKILADMNLEANKVLPGDLMTAEILVKFVNGKAHIKPICADLFDLGDRIHKVWDDTDPVEWVLEQLE